jgi:hypothetical protein
MEEDDKEVNIRIWIRAETLNLTIPKRAITKLS